MARDDEVRKALELHGDELMAYPNVRGLGVGEKVADTKGSGELALVVYVTKKVPLEQLGEDEVLPKTVAIGNENEATKEVPVDVVELGELSFEGIA
jgi:hypothetical protein